jgi:hypothetical protein
MITGLCGVYNFVVVCAHTHLPPFLGRFQSTPEDRPSKPRAYEPSACDSEHLARLCSIDLARTHLPPLADIPQLRDGAFYVCRSGMVNLMRDCGC